MIRKARLGYLSVPWSGSWSRSMPWSKDWPWFWSWHGSGSKSWKGHI